jgi:hypothetical protein
MLSCKLIDNFIWRMTMKKLTFVLTFLTAFYLYSVSASADIAGMFHRLTGTIEPTKNIMVLVDDTESISAEDKMLYASSFQSIVQSIQPGDRVMLAKISDQGRAAFRLAADMSIPRTGIRLDDAENVKTARSALQSQFDEMLKTVGQRKATLILDAVTASAEALKPANNTQSYLVVLSDMVEESKLANFSKTIPSVKLLGPIKKAHLLPALPGVSILVCGAAGKYYAESEVFWAGYFQAAGADLKIYGRMPIKSL